ncbi:hypothetical protein PspLS_10430 [Pyricularia sp. CBS 133598]|nr:hypothetical protein PspLS_10430 [Pyricularia sp. CBS 133598]
MWNPFKFPKEQRFEYEKCSGSRDSSGSDRETEESTCHSCSAKDQQVAALTRQTRYLQVYTALTSLTLIIVAASLALMQAQNLVKSRADMREERHHLGSDPNGFVPRGVGEPPRWTYFSKDSPYFVPEDTFYNINKTEAVVERIKRVHNSSNVLVNGHSADWKHPDGTMTKLPFYYSTGTVRQMYIIRAFHQMHCLIVITEEYGYRVNNRTSAWTPSHIAHCINTIREAVMCLADATPMSYVNGFGVGHVTDEQQFMCRDWGALRKWANDPKRGVRVRANNKAKGGAERLEEIVPFPELTEMQQLGLE